MRVNVKPTNENPARHECHNGKHERLPENDIARRAEWLDRRKQHGIHG